MKVLRGGHQPNNAVLLAHPYQGIFSPSAELLEIADFVRGCSQRESCDIANLLPHKPTKHCLESLEDR